MQRRQAMLSPRSATRLRAGAGHWWVFESFRCVCVHAAGVGLKPGPGPLHCAVPRVAQVVSVRDVGGLVFDRNFGQPKRPFGGFRSTSERRVWVSPRPSHCGGFAHRPNIAAPKKQLLQNCWVIRAYWRPAVEATHACDRSRRAKSHYVPWGTENPDRNFGQPPFVSISAKSRTTDRNVQP